ncbi:hypothetical protein WJX81_005653 [Elliptochloris bilobata]|uniref:Fucosyltransferase n=1 Tax=Elliptochloris bilobata TaxID=381761 RepID=A0AAW1RR78_9CHLO
MWCCAPLRWGLWVCAAAAALLQLAQACIVIELNPSGFHANVNNLLALIPLVASLHNDTVHYRLEAFHYKCAEDGGLADFLDSEQLALWPLARGNRDKIRALGCVYGTLKYGWDLRAKLRPRIPMEDLIADALDRNWRYQPDVQTRVDAALKQLASKPGPTIAFHARGGDKRDEDMKLHRKIVAAGDAVESFIRAWPDVRGGTCVIVGDDDKMATDIGEAAERAIGCQAWRPTTYRLPGGHNQSMFTHSSYDLKCAATREMFVDEELMANSDYLVGSYNSGILQFITVLRHKKYGKSRTTYVDSSERLFDWNTMVQKALASNQEAVGQV